MFDKYILVKPNMVVKKEMDGFKFKIYQGLRFINFDVTNNMVGHKFGEFLKSRKLHVYKKKK